MSIFYFNSEISNIVKHRIMRFINKSAVLIFVLLIGQYANILSARSERTIEPYKILFIGSSYFDFNNLPGLFYYLATGSGKEVIISRRILSGLYLSDHAQSSSTLVKIQEKDWDFVILQGVGSVTAYPETYTSHPVYPSLVNLVNKIKNNCETTRVILCMPWAFEDGMTWVPGWTDEYEEMQRKIYTNTLFYSDEIGFEIAPVGWAWNTVLEEKDYPLHYLHLNDWNHPSQKGSYLMNCVIFTTIFNESPIGFTNYGGLDPEDALYFQTIASNTVLNDLDLWNIITSPTGVRELSISEDIFLQQNYPNPFSSSTQINYNIFSDTYIEIEVFDSFGNLCTKLVNEHKPPGNYSVEFDGSKFSSGT